MSTYKICPTATIPEFDPHVSWKQRIANWLRMRPRSRMVVMTSDHKLMCNPASVPSVRRFLENQGLAYDIAPQLAAVPSAEAEQ